MPSPSRIVRVKPPGKYRRREYVHGLILVVASCLLAGVTIVDHGGIHHCLAGHSAFTATSFQHEFGRFTRVCDRQPRAVRTGLQATPAQLTTLIRTSDNVDELVALAAEEALDMVHRATLLYMFAERLKRKHFGDDVVQKGSALESLGETSGFRTVLEGLLADLASWKQSGSLKESRSSKKGPREERAQYLGNIIWSLGELGPAVDVVLSPSEQSLLWKRATFACVEALPDITASNATANICQVLFGLRLLKRTFQLDAFFRGASTGLVDRVLVEPKRVTRKMSLANFVLAYGQYGMRDPLVTNLFRNVQQLVLHEAWNSADASEDLANLLKLLKGYALYEFRRQHPKPEPSEFSVTLNKNISKLGLKYAVVGGRHELPVDAVAHGKAAWRWNVEYPDWAIERNDRISEVNDIRGTAGQLNHSIITSRSFVTLTLRRNISSFGQAAKGDAGSDTSIDSYFLNELASRTYDIVSRVEAVEGQVPLRTLTTLILSCRILGVNFQPLLSMVATNVESRGRYFGFNAVAQFLWAFANFPASGDRALVQTLVERAEKLLSDDNFRGFDNYSHELILAMVYQSLLKLSYAPEDRIVKQIGEAAARYGISMARLTETFAIPPTWD
eukprot:TRINITY_DN41603_c0_g1_i1.p1 TRINITY_DN41603_c0_g1~~TRINITY_DN41603_c0_g1_i1.p1  ORF type:complete len:618 (-),score=51.48 TRINITY_DN41603_c0_g1_i1:209-2062(-)